MLMERLEMDRWFYRSDRQTHETGYRLIIISNQNGIAREKMTTGDLNDIHRHMNDIPEQGGKI